MCWCIWLRLRTRERKREKKRDPPNVGLNFVAFQTEEAGQNLGPDLYLRTTKGPFYKVQMSI